MSIAQQFAAYTDWRNQLETRLEHLRNWLAENELDEAQTGQRLAQLIDRLRDDHLRVAFVAEFSRGKSELINAIFFADYGNRMLPSSAGRTTMCPTELMHDPDKAPCIELLPIETRASNDGIAECKRFPDRWTRFPLDIASAESMQEALQQVSEVIQVDCETAGNLGFDLDDGNLHAHAPDPVRTVEIPRWRHAVINFPHPLLKQGLVILDTPGLNAVGTEPELTLSLLPSAHAVLFILAADTGVTQSDLAVWRKHLDTPDDGRKGRLVVLNKIDSQWDELKSEAAIDAEITRQVDSCAHILKLPASQIFPVSAQKGLVAKITADEALLSRSRLPLLEHALSSELIPAKQSIIREDAGHEFGVIDRQARQLLESRLAALHEQLAELNELRGKNRSVIEYMLGKTRHEKTEFEAGLQHFYAVRSILTSLTNKLFAHLGLDALRALTQSTREAMHEATFSRQLSEAMKDFFRINRDALARSRNELDEIHRMASAAYRKFAVEHGLKLEIPENFPLLRYEQELDRLEAWCDTHLNTMFQLMRHEKGHLTQRFFEEVAVQTRRAFEHANRHVEEWLKEVMAPMENQIREHQRHLRHRLESIKRIHQATETLEDRVSELGHTETVLQGRIAALAAMAGELRSVLQRTIGSSGLPSAAHP